MPNGFRCNLRQAWIENYKVLTREHGNRPTKQPRNSRAHPRAHGGDSDQFMATIIKITWFATLILRPILYKLLFFSTTGWWPKSLNTIKIFHKKTWKTLATGLHGAPAKRFGGILDVKWAPSLRQRPVFCSIKRKRHDIFQEHTMFATSSESEDNGNPWVC